MKKLLLLITIGLVLGSCKKKVTIVASECTFVKDSNVSDTLGFDLYSGGGTAEPNGIYDEGFFCEEIRVCGNLNITATFMNDGSGRQFVIRKDFIGGGGSYAVGGGTIYSEDNGNYTIENNTSTTYLFDLIYSESGCSSGKTFIVINK